MNIRGKRLEKFKMLEEGKGINCRSSEKEHDAEPFQDGPMDRSDSFHPWVGAETTAPNKVSAKYPAAAHRGKGHCGGD